MELNAEIFLVQQYTQTDGSFNIQDNTERFYVLNQGAANFNGGTVNFTSSLGYGTLNTNNITFNGATLNMRIDGNTSSSDLINCSNCTIKNTSTIKVTANSQERTGELWTLIQAAPGDTITGDFGSKNLPSGVVEDETTTAWNLRSS